MRKLLSLTILALSMVLFAGCQKQDDVAPASPNSAESLDKKINPRKSITTLVSGTVDGAKFRGVLHIYEFVEDSGKIYARGYLTEVVTRGKHAVAVANLLQGERYKIPVTFLNTDGSPTGDAQQAPVRCNILLLNLGPLHLNVLGLVVDLNQVILPIYAVPGANNLLGNLLCAITGLLSPLGSLIEIVALLNQIIQLIGNLL